MARARTFTASFSAVSNLADRALSTSQGGDIHFTLERYGSPQGCAHAARSFQNTFSAMRAQDRNRSPYAKAERANNGGVNPAITFARSEYDALVCQRKVLPDGSWVVSLMKGASYLNSFTLIDRATGKDITEEVMGPQMSNTPNENTTKDVGVLTYNELFGKDEEKDDSVW